MFAAGTGNPYFTTDTAAALRAMEMRAEVILKGTKVDGIYTADPMIDKTAERYETISYLRGARARPQGDGRDGHHALHGQQAADRRVQPAAARQPAARHHGRAVGTRVTRRRSDSPVDSTDPREVLERMDVNDLKGLNAEVKKRMDSAIEHVRRELAGLRSGRASVSLLDPVQVEAYGTSMPLNQVASLSIPEPTLIVAQPFDPSLMTAIETRQSRKQPRAEPGVRRQGHPHSDSAAHRGAAQGDVAARAQVRRGRPQRRPPGPPRRQRPAEEAPQGPQDFRRRRAARARRRAEDHRPARRR